jgi:RpiR family carbohydrate utilization transcriptional regulator
MSATTQIKTMYNALRPVQRRIADYFLGADFNALDASIEEVAKKTGTSVASISRFCKKLGYESLGQFKITLSRDLKYEPDTVLPIFRMDDDPDLSIRKVFSEVITNLQATQGTVDFGAIKTAAARIMKSDIVYFFGLGGSGGVGYLGEVLFTHIGKRAESVSDAYKMIISAGHANEKTLILGLSHSGRTKSVIEAVKIGRSKGAFTAGMTNYAASPLAAAVDLVLLTACHERRMHFAQSDSMVAQLTIIRALYMLTASRSGEKTVKNVNDIERYVGNLIRANKNT